MHPFGPVLWYDLRRMSRRQRYRLLCCLMALGMLVMLYCLFQPRIDEARHRGAWQSSYDRGYFDHSFEAYYIAIYREALVETGSRFFQLFMLVQWLVFLCLTPAVVAGAIAEEKQKRTVDYLFTTHLTPREIVAGKLLSRLWVLLMLLLAGLPVMCMAFTFGGIVPELLWGGYLVTVMMMFSLASVSILHSVFARTVRQAILNSYLTLGGYFLGWGMLEFLYELMRSGTDSHHAAWLMRNFIDGYNFGNPFVMAEELTRHFRQTGSLGGRPAELLAQFMVFHSVVIVVCLVVAVLFMRAACLRQKLGRVKKRVAAAPPVPPTTPQVMPKPPPRRQAKPPVGDRPMYWKECHAERTFKLGPLGKSILVVATLAIGAPAFVYYLPVSILAQMIGMDSDFTSYARDANGYLRWTGAVLVTWIILAMAVRAATCVSSERERQTWESLRATPVSLWEIILAKWVGCWWSVRWHLLLLAAMCLCLVLSGGLYWPCLFLIAPQVIAWGGFFAALGLWLSARCKNAVMALALTILTLTVFSALPWLAYLWTEERQKQDLTHQLLERLSPPYGWSEICLTKEEANWGHVRNFDSYYESYYSPRGDRRSRHLDQAGDVTALAANALLAIAAGLLWLAHRRLRHEGRA